MRAVGLTQVGVKELDHNLAIRDKVLELEAVMEKMAGAVSGKDVDQLAPVNNYFCKGNYAREIFITKDTCMVGKIHKHEHINVISQGKCIVVTEDGKETLEAPLTFISKAGIKRAVYAVEDTVWTTIHPTEQTDLSKVEDEVIAKSYRELEYIL